MAKVNVFNPTGTPVQVDDDGHSLGGRESMSIDKTGRVEELIRLGFLVEQPKEEKQVEANADAPTKKKEGK